MKEKFRVYMTQGQGEVLVGEYDNRDAAELEVHCGNDIRKDGAYSYVQIVPNPLYIGAISGLRAWYEEDQEDNIKLSRNDVWNLLNEIDNIHKDCI